MMVAGRIRKGAVGAIVINNFHHIRLLPCSKINNRIAGACTPYARTAAIGPAAEIHRYAVRAVVARGAELRNIGEIIGHRPAAQAIGRVIVPSLNATHDSTGPVWLPEQAEISSGRLD